MNSKKLFLFLFSIFVFVVFAHADDKKYAFVVAKDGSGDFKTVQEAINAVPDMRKTRTYIFVKNGKYKEKLTLPANKTNVSLVGEGTKGTIIYYDDYAQRKNRFGEEIGTSGSSSFFVYGDGFTADNITFQNSAGPVGQAVAVRIDGDKVTFRNCRFLGFQDTLYPHGRGTRQYFYNCYIEGTVDYIFGFSTAYFEFCTLYCKRGGYVTAASTPEDQKYGFVFQNCKITGNAPNFSFFLGRPWRPYAKVVYMECQMDSVINIKGWDNWGNATNEKTAFYAEYQCYGVGTYPRNKKEKRVSWAHHLTDAEAEMFSKEAVLGDWDPETTK